MNPFSYKDVDLLIQQLELLVSTLNKDPNLLYFYTFFAIAEKLAETKRHPLDLPQVQKFIVLLENISSIRNKCFPDVSFSYRSLRTVLEIMDSEANTLSTLYNSVRPDVTKTRKLLLDQFRASFRQQIGENYQDLSFGFSRLGEKESMVISQFWTNQLDLALNSFRQNKSAEAIDSIIACLPHWVDSSCDRLVNVRGQRKEITALQIIDIINNYLNICDEIIDIIRQMATSALAQLPILDPVKVQNEIEQKDLEQLNQLKHDIAEIKILKELPKTEKAQLKALKEKLNNELSTLLEKQKQQLEETIHENKKQRKKFESLEKRAKVYREQTILRLEREVLKTLAYLIHVYDLQRTQDPMWATAKKEMRRIFIKINSMST